jgi:dolichyl-phosphate-mannose-protein mannosyltransferase
MLPGQAAATGMLVQAKLTIRRVLRHWRSLSRAHVRRGSSGLLDIGCCPGDGLDVSASRRTRGARLPVQPPDKVNAVVVAACLFAFALAVRCHRISEPAAVVFDELHFGKFVNSYWDGEYSFDIHPPGGKLHLYLVSRLFSSQRPSSNFTRIGETYHMPADAAYVPMRISSAFFGAVLPPTTFLIARELGLGKWPSVAPAFAQAVDSLLVIESRLVLMDSQLAAFSALCLLCALRLWGARKRTRRRAKYLVLTAVFGTFALSVKWTSLATPALIAIVSLIGAPFPREGRLDVAEMGVAGFLTICIYTLYFYIHFALLPYSGQGDKFMTDEFQRTLIGSPTYDAAAPRPSFLRNIFYLNARMLSASASIKTRHAWESKWYSWIASWRGVLYFVKMESGRSARVYLTSNLVVSYAALAAVVGFAVYLVAVYVPRRRSAKPPHAKEHGTVARGCYMLAGYVFNLLPYILVHRCTFLYHYCPALFYAELLLANCLDALPSRPQRLTSFIFMLLTAAFFIRWSPWTYATPISEDRHRRLAVYGASWQ